MSALMTFITSMLIPAGVLPVVTAVVLTGYRHASSAAARDRWHVSLAMAALGAVTAFLAANAVFGLGFEGEWLTLPFALALLVADIVSGKWLWDYWRGKFR